MPKLYDTVQERRHAMYDSASSRERRTEENRKPGPRGKMRVRHLDEESELGTRHHRETKDLTQKHAMERSENAQTNKRPADVDERQQRELAHLSQKHAKEREAMIRRHAGERKKIAPAIAALFFLLGVNAAHADGVGYAKMSIADGAVHALKTVPPGAFGAEICNEGAAARYRDDGTPPTRSVGMPIGRGTSANPSCISYNGPLNSLLVVQQGAGASVLNLRFYR